MGKKKKIKESLIEDGFFGTTAQFLDDWFNIRFIVKLLEEKDLCKKIGLYASGIEAYFKLALTYPDNYVIIYGDKENSPGGGILILQKVQKINENGEIEYIAFVVALYSRYKKLTKILETLGQSWCQSHGIKKVQAYVNPDFKLNGLNKAYGFNKKLLLVEKVI